MVRRPRVAVFSPFSPKPSGIADYAELSLHLIATSFDCTLVTDEYNPLPEKLPSGVDIVHASQLRLHDLKQRFDCAVYHVGNSPLHTYMYPFMASRPGLMVLHDYWTMGTRQNHALSLWQGEGFRREMCLAYGEKRGGDAAEIILSGLHHNSFLRFFSLSEFAVRCNAMTLVHQEWLKKHLQRQVPHADIRTIPHYLEYPVERSEERRSAARKCLGCGSSTFVVGFFGGVVTEKQPESCLRSFAWLHERIPDSKMIIAGSLGEDVPLAGWIHKYDLNDAVTFLGRISDDSFYTMMQACDCQLLLRWPTNRESSGVLINSFHFGVPAIVSNLAHYAEFSDDIVVRVALTAQEKQLREQLFRLATNNELRHRLSQAGRRYVTRHHNRERATAAWKQALEDCCRMKMEPPFPAEALPAYLVLS